MNSQDRKRVRRLREEERRKGKRKELQKSFDEVINFNNLYISGKRCCLGCGWKASVINFKVDLVLKTAILLESLRTGTYEFRGFNSFTRIEHGKQRDLDALHIEDRQLQKCFCDFFMTELYSRYSVYEYGASLKYKGMHFQIELLKSHLRREYRKSGLSGGIYQFDFTGYYSRIIHSVLKERARDLIEDDRLYTLLCGFIDDFKLMRTYNKDSIPKGIGLGSQVSNNLAMDYASPLDHYIKDQLGIKGYGRYNDDGYIICSSIEELLEVRRKVRSKAEELGIVLSEKKERITLFRGHSFRFLKLGFSISDSGKVYVRLSRASKKAIYRKLKIFRKWLDQGKLEFIDVLRSYVSWRSYAVKFDSYYLLGNSDDFFLSMFREEVVRFNKPIKVIKEGRFMKTTGDSYIVYRRYSGESLNGRITLECGTPLVRVNNFLVSSRGLLFAVYSDVHKKHIAINMDGKGLERGRLISEILVSDFKGPYRFSDKQRLSLLTRWSKYLRDDTDFILFTDEFYDLPIEVLQEILNTLKEADVDV